MSAAERAQRVAEYLVYLALAGRQRELRAIYEYYVENRSPAEIRDGPVALPTTVVCGIIGRVREKAGGHAVAKLVVEALYPRLRDELPVIRRGLFEYAYCDYCKQYISAVDPTQHLLRKHRQQIRELAERLLREAGLAP